MDRFGYASVKFQPLYDIIQDEKLFDSVGKIMIELEELRMYIKAAERQTLQAEPEPSGKQFSAIYPYAFAMG